MLSAMFCPLSLCINGVNCQFRIIDIPLDSMMVRLSGINMLSGLVEVFNGVQWGYVCADHWTKTEADVVCSQLGYRGRYPRGNPP